MSSYSYAEFLKEIKRNRADRFPNADEKTSLLAVLAPISGYTTVL